MIVSQNRFENSHGTVVESIVFYPELNIVLKVQEYPNEDSTMIAYGGNESQLVAAKILYKNKYYGLLK